MSVICKLTSSHNRCPNSPRSLVTEACEDFHYEGLIPLHAIDGRFHLTSQFDDDYEWTNEEAGRGVGGVVRIATRTGDDNERTSKRCVKKYRKRSQVGRDLDEVEEEIKRECSIYLSVDHPNIARLLDVYEDDNYVTIVMEYCRGGTMEDRIRARYAIAEVTAKAWLAQLLMAISHLHHKGIAHRDVKPLNVVFSDTSDNSMLKLIDFGESDTCPNVDTGDMLRGMAGTPNYLAPEMLESRADNGNWYGAKCDLWATGVTLFKMLSGKEPFSAPPYFMCGHGDSDDDDADEDWMMDIRKGVYTFDEKAWAQVSAEARHLTTQLLTVDQEKRPDADGAMKHEWLAAEVAARKSVEVVSENLVAVVNSFKSFAAASVMMRNSLRTVSWSKVVVDGSLVLPLFSAFDRRNLGVVYCEDFTSTLQDAGAKMSAGDCKSLFDQLMAEYNSDSQKAMTYADFTAALLPMQMGKDSFVEAALTPTTYLPSEAGHSESLASLPEVVEEVFDSRCGLVAGGSNVESLLKQISRHRYRSVCVGETNNIKGFVDLLDVNKLLLSKLDGIVAGNEKQVQQALDSLANTHCADIVNYSTHNVWSPLPVTATVSDVLRLLMEPDVRRVPLLHEDGRVATVVTPQMVLVMVLMQPEMANAMNDMKANSFENRDKVRETWVEGDNTVLAALQKIAANDLWLGPVVNRELSSADAEGAVAVGVLAAADLKKVLEMGAHEVLSLEVNDFLALRDMRLPAGQEGRYPYLSVKQDCTVRVLAESLLAVNAERIFLTSDILNRIVGVIGAQDILRMAWPKLSGIQIATPVASIDGMEQVMKA